MCGDASGPGELRGCCRATQGGLGCAREGCWQLVGLQGCWYGCAAPGLELAQLDDAELRADSALSIRVLGPGRELAGQPAAALSRAVLVGSLVCPPSRMPCKSPWKIGENSSSGRREAATVALGFPITSVCLFPTQI